MDNKFDNIVNNIKQISDCTYLGKVVAIQGLFIEIQGIRCNLSIGDRCIIRNLRDQDIACEVVSFKSDNLLVMPYGSMEGIGNGCVARVENSTPVIYPHISWLGRVINAFGEPIDGKGDLIKGNKPYFIKNSPPPATQRKRVCGKLDLGVRAVNTFLTVCKGQRMGIFAGSGIGKSTLMSMMAKNTDADISVIGLIGRRIYQRADPFLCFGNRKENRRSYAPGWKNRSCHPY